jgi:rfaE bifunctional protein nucleotidyltransferase chain/domain
MLSKNKLIASADFDQLGNELKTKHQKLVFTNGCFDLLHAGHVVFLEEAKSLGDYLMVAVNSDSSVSRLKGKNRPIIPLDQRICMLSAITFVDAVVVFDADTPESLIKAVKPDVLVKGNDYDVSNIAGAQFVMSYGGIVKTLPLLEGISTSSIIRKIKLN